MAWRRRLVAATAAAAGLSSSSGRVGARIASLQPFRAASSASSRSSRLAGALLGGRFQALRDAPIARASSARNHASKPDTPPPAPPVLTSRPSPSTILLTLNRPAALNALNEATMHALISAAVAADADPSVRAIIIAGSGHIAFAAGADVKELAGHTYQSAVSTRLLDAWRSLKHVRTPIIAAVEGFALGGGCELVAACDVAVAGEGATFGQPEVGLGVVPGMGGTQRLPRAVGKAMAMDLLLTGRRLSAAEALASGLVSRVVPAGGALEEAHAVAAAIARSPRAAVSKAKELAQAAFEMPLSAGLETELREFWACFGSDEQIGGMGAFLEKRAKVG